jgi:LuxR family transcriptional regulator, maltose regulon positive regulatory protein
VIEETRSAAARRAPAPPQALSHELVRPRVLGELARRFDVAVTVVVAGAGFGKTTALAQAIRANQAEPRGIDAWISCEPGDEDSRRLAVAIAGALGAPADGDDPINTVLDAIRTLSPLDVCLIFDDLHEVPSTSTAAALLTELTRRLPPNAHLLMASREPVPQPLARLRAAGRVIEVTADQLALTDSEAEMLAISHGHDRVRVEGMAGWPSLVRLSLSAPPGATRQFLWEEVVAGLTPPEQLALSALATLGWGSVDDVEQVAGKAVDLDDLVDKVPLVRRGDNEQFAVHHLWEEAVGRLFDADTLRGMRTRALALLLDRGEWVRAGALALRWEEPDAVALAARSLVRESFGALPVDTATRWLATATDDMRARPDLELLELAVRHAQSIVNPELDDEVDRLAQRFAAEGNHEGEAVALALGTVVAHTRGDNGRLLLLAERVCALPDAHEEPILRFLTGAVGAALAALLGDVDAVLTAIDELDFSQVPASITELVTRLHVAALASAGRADEAVVVGERLRRSPSLYVRQMPDQLHWLAGDPSPYATARPPVDPGADTNARDRFFHAVYTTAMAASFGDRTIIASQRPAVEKVAAGSCDARDSALVAVATAYERVVEHDQKGAARSIVDHLARHPIDDPLGDMHLRRYLPLPYLCSEEIRERWDSAELGPSHERARSVARHLLDARHGHLTPGDRLPVAPLVFTSLPLPWSVELAALAAANGCEDGQSLVVELATWAPAELRAELRWLADHGGRLAASGASDLLGLVPEPAGTPLFVEILGPLRLSITGTAIESPELRRGRVRALLALLVIAGPIRRERVMDLLWPDLDPGAAARNLRVTLTRLRHLLEPGRPAGATCTTLRIEGESLALASRPYLDVDLWQFHQHLAEADLAEQTGAAESVPAHLEAACRLWRGDPFSDLTEVDDLAPELAEVRRTLVDVTIRLGEWRFLAGRFDDAHASAQRALRASPYDERAHRLAIASRLQTGDREGLHLAVARVNEALRDLDVPPDDATQMLIRQAAARDGRLE